ncbi:hypothetical protein [Streptomyces hygroscopicus]|uniref:hypothetical protein n=1 Tax=Streptomyces hygroscopicus TaxID=1912 RepID=UPI000AB3DA13|nr:hypothetical protein [Streptomyces hygroscopicus]
MSDLNDSISAALGEYGDDYDIDAITETLSAAGCTTVDDVSDEEFWAIAEANELPEVSEATSVERFREEVTAALRTKRPSGQPGVWQRGGVTLRIEGASRVNYTWPQSPLTVCHLAVAGGEEITIAGDSVGSWEALWGVVEPVLNTWSATVADRRREYEAATRAAEAAQKAARKAAAAARRAEEALNVLLPDADHSGTTMTQAQVAEYLGIAPGSVRKQMSRWNIEATYERGSSGRAEARYPAAEVQARASRRPGRGYRTDLHTPR